MARATLNRLCGDRVTRGVRAVRKVRLVPEANSELLAVFQQAEVGSFFAKHHFGTFVHLLHVFGTPGRAPYVSTAVVNAWKLFRVLGGHANVRWLPSPPKKFSWDTTIHDTSTAPPPKARKRWVIAYDYRPDLVLGPRDYAIPYGMHPGIQHSLGAAELRRQLTELRRRERFRRLLFSSSLGSLYSRPAELTVLGDKLNRLRIAAILRNDGGFQSPNASASTVIPSPEPLMVFRDTAVDKVPKTAWLAELASSDFVVCPPGCIMPMSFNIIEALGVGSIPLTNYPDWFFPKLQDGVNCVAFDTEADLRRRIDDIRAMSPSTIRKMREAAIAYYDEYLDPHTVAHRIRSADTDSLTLHVLDETFSSLGIPPRRIEEAGAE